MAPNLLCRRLFGPPCRQQRDPTFRSQTRSSPSPLRNVATSASSTSALDSRVHPRGLDDAQNLLRLALEVVVELLLTCRSVQRRPQLVDLINQPVLQSLQLRLAFLGARLGAQDRIDEFLVGFVECGLVLGQRVVDQLGCFGGLAGESSSSAGAGV